MVYAQSIKESKLSRIYRNLKRSGPSEQNQPRFKKKAPIQDEPRDLEKEVVLKVAILLIGINTMGND